MKTYTKLETKKIIKLIKDKMKELNRDGVILGLSGGIDSSVTATLCAKAVTPEKVTALLMFEKDSHRKHYMDAKRLAEELKINFLERDITKQLKSYPVYNLLPRLLMKASLNKKLLQQVKISTGKGFLYYVSELANHPIIKKINAFYRIKHRIRMLNLYYEAEENNLLVVGAANRTEKEIGYFVKFGVDHCADVMPIIHLYKTQVVKLAKHLRIPEKIVKKAAAPDVLKGLTDEAVIGMNFEELDKILNALNNGEKLKNAKKVKYVKELINHSNHMRESPYHL